MTATQRTYNGPYTGAFLDRVAFPMGGIGAGMLCLEGTGALSHVSVRGHPDVFNEPLMFAALSVRVNGEPNNARLLEGPVPPWKVFFPWGKSFGGAGSGGREKSYGLPRCARAEFRTRFPFGAVTLEEPSIPLEMEITGWSPFIPGDADNSSLPVAALEYRFRNPTGQPVEAVFSFHAKNFMSLSDPMTRMPLAGSSVQAAPGGFVLAQTGSQEQPWGEGAFSATTDDPDVRVNCALFRGGWFDPLTMVWNAIRDGAIVEGGPVTEGAPSPGGSLYVLPTYTAMLGLRETLVHRGVAEAFWRER
jgi:hypothetical protein